MRVWDAVTFGLRDLLGDPQVVFPNPDAAVTGYRGWFWRFLSGEEPKRLLSHPPSRRGGLAFVRPPRPKSRHIATAH